MNLAIFFPKKGYQGKVHEVERRGHMRKNETIFSMLIASSVLDEDNSSTSCKATDSSSQIFHPTTILCIQINTMQKSLVIISISTRLPCTKHIHVYLTFAIHRASCNKLH
ncbi:hypothetical protein KIL84_003363 [Mauremys mutica]|uniref:Uncharacterized protein n=1 Tax=Mauremys mutica TaxID=74926 RepID=A0A9D4ATF6_9SAUR|nr:hypothetical protein KIL84_003363 [Mauremys mutica]